MYIISATIAWDELQKKLKQTPLLQQRGGVTVYPYEHADVTLRRLKYSDVQPTSTYLARNLLAVQKQIAKDIAARGYDPLELECGLTLSAVDDNGIETLTGFIPPIVEQTDADGTYIVDGSHRAHLGRWAGRTWFTAIVISGVRDDCPFYAQPNTWDDVIIYDEPPRQAALRKQYRQNHDNPYSLYRDFSALNGSRPRN